MGAGRAFDWLRRPLSDPATRGLCLDDPQTTILRREIIRSKPFLNRIYREWYELLLASLPRGQGRVLELGSGGGFFKEVFPELLASEVVAFQDIDLVADGRLLPFRGAALRAIVMTDVFHHLPDVRSFLREAGRCVRPGGVLAMIEPWVSFWSRIIYRYLHHEPFAPEAPAWEFPSGGPLSGANNALPWIVFARDRSAFDREFPQWSIQRIEPFMPIRYLLSGGVSVRSLMPAFTFDLWRRAEGALGGALKKVAMFALIVVERKAG
jgi:SAM-dependent methyltransferase